MGAGRPSSAALESLYEDDDLHAIAKPAGLATVSERWNRQAPTVIGELWKLWQRRDPDAPRPHVVHRLDKETTGVLLFAKNRDAQVGVRAQFRARSVEKRYLALVRGCPQPHTGTICIDVAAHPSHPARMEVVKKGKACITDYEVIEIFRDLSLVRLRPHTGRTHQIRVSLEFIGHPCAVDAHYGGAEALFVSAWKRHYHTGRGRTERPIIDRVTLHAESLGLRHPRTEEPIEFTAPLAADLAATLKQLRRWATPPERTSAGEGG